MLNGMTKRSSRVVAPLLSSILSPASKFHPAPTTLTQHSAIHVGEVRRLSSWRGSGSGHTSGRRSLFVEATTEQVVLLNLSGSEEGKQGVR